MQKKVINDLSTLIEKMGYEVITIPVYSNSGHISIQYPDVVGELGGVTYTFENAGFASRMTFRIKIGDTYVLSHPPRKGHYDFILPYTDLDGYENFRNVLENEIGLMKELA